MRGAGGREALPGSILWWVFRSMLDPLFRQLCSFSTAVCPRGRGAQPAAAGAGTMPRGRGATAP